MSTALTSEHLIRPFAGSLGEDYEFIKLICPNVPTLHANIGTIVQTCEGKISNGRLRVFEIGCGTGLLTAAILNARDDVQIVAIDNEPTMLRQARVSLGTAVEQGKLALLEADALDHLQGLSAGIFDVVASAYCLHNFTQDYRSEVLQEIVRVLRPGGRFVNGDRYALDDASAHVQTVQREVTGYFSTFKALNRLDLLEKWIVHLLGDEAPDHIMRENAAVAAMRKAGFERFEWIFRSGIDGLMSASKPLA